MKVVFLTHQEPAPVGTGGGHRAYQIAWELAQAVGAENLQIISFPQWKRSVKAEIADRTVNSHKQKLVKAMRHRGRSVPLLRAAASFWRKSFELGDNTSIRHRLHCLSAKHPVDALMGAGWVTRKVYPTRGSEHRVTSDFLSYYTNLLLNTAHPVISVMDHVGFSSILPLNARLGIPTVCCPQNLDSLAAAAPLEAEAPRELYMATLGFADECTVFSRCQARLFISKVEAGLIGGLGLQSTYYPYMPVGAVRESLFRIRRIREERTAEAGLLLICGTASWGPSRASLEWFVDSARRYGVPPGVKIVIAGERTDRLLLRGESVSGIDLRGWLPQHELDDLMARAQAMLVPQYAGLGAVTRVSEASCAGIPVLTSNHAGLALNLPPGVVTVEKSWAEWYQKLERAFWRDIHTDRASYETWESEQPRPLASMLAHLFDGPASVERHLGPLLMCW